MADTADDDVRRFEPDDDATELDRQLMAIARNLHSSGWTDDADSLLSAIAQLREGWSQAAGNLGEIYDALVFIEASAATAMTIIERTHPDSFWLRAKEV